MPGPAVLVDYHFYHDKLAAFVHRRGKPPARIELGNRAETENTIRAWRAQLNKGMPGIALGAKLKARIWTPLEKHLGDAMTVLVSPDGHLGFAPPAPPWLATAGTGDVLAGMIAALRARGLDAFEAACAGVWLQCRAAELAGPGMIADDLADAIPRAISE